MNTTTFNKIETQWTVCVVGYTPLTYSENNYVLIVNILYDFSLTHQSLINESQLPGLILKKAEPKSRLLNSHLHQPFGTAVNMLTH